MLDPSQDSTSSIVLHRSLQAGPSHGLLPGATHSQEKSFALQSSSVTAAAQKGSASVAGLKSSRAPLYWRRHRISPVFHTQPYSASVPQVLSS